jgi:hypothetical protein
MLMSCALKSDDSESSKSTAATQLIVVQLGLPPSYVFFSSRVLGFLEIEIVTITERPKLSLGVRALVHDARWASRHTESLLKSFDRSLDGSPRLTGVVRLTSTPSRWSSTAVVVLRRCWTVQLRLLTVSYAEVMRRQSSGESIAAAMSVRY